MSVFLSDKLKAGYILLFLLVNLTKVYSQSNPLGASYYQNQYLLNPAMAGLKSTTLNLNLDSRRLWDNIPGGPSTQALTLDYNLNGKAALGMNFNRDKAGLIQSLRALGTFAYHLPLNEKGDSFSLGISMGMMNERINLDAVKGDQDDVILGRFNDRQTYMDGDFGAAFISNRLTLQAAIPNLKSFFNKDDLVSTVDRVSFFSALSYRFNNENSTGIVMEPKVSYRVVSGMNNILDIGSSFIYVGRINLFGMYHTSKSATFGLGMLYQNLGFCLMYSTSTGELRQYTTGSFEINAQVKLFRKKPKVS